MWRSAATHRRIAGLQPSDGERAGRHAIGCLDEKLGVPRCAGDVGLDLRMAWARASPFLGEVVVKRESLAVHPEAISASTIDDGPTRGTTAIPGGWPPPRGARRDRRCRDSPRRTGARGRRSLRAGRAARSTDAASGAAPSSTMAIAGRRARHERASRKARAGFAVQHGAEVGRGRAQVVR